MIQILPYGDRAILINFEQIIDPEVNAWVISLEAKMKAKKIPGIQGFIPAYCSLTIFYDPFQISYSILKEAIEIILQQEKKDARSGVGKIWEIPVCYEDEFALDMEDVCQETGLRKEEIISLHTSTTFRVYMLGFLPGFLYLGKVPQALQCKRKANPRLRVPERAVALAGQQTGVYPYEVPGGWQIIGKTPFRTFEPANENPFNIQAGDRVRFQAIGKEEYQRIIHSI